MRKIILSACLLLSTIIACGQFTSNTGIPPYTSLPVYTNLPGIDYVFIFNGITSSSDITYTGTGSTFNWYKFSDPNTSISNVNYISPEDATGYTVIVDGGIPIHIWVIDYKNYLPVIKSFEPENNPQSQCKNVNLLIDGTIPVLNYKTFDGVVYNLPRQFKIKYQTLSWGGDSKWDTKDTIQSLVLPASQITVPAPYTNTVFKLYGDQYATDLGLTPDTVSSSLYTTNAVISHLATIVTSRDQGQGKNNEVDYPQSNKTPINFSAPIDVQFLSNANEPTTQFYNWGIYKDNQLIVKRTDKDQRYTFTDAGTYTVKLTVSNSICSYSDSITVITSVSEIYVPNVFTPNGDGFNDEFRVAYNSLISFQCWVYNRWGRQVYYWNDPTKGWDGNINGKKAVPGAYFYIIKAVGSDKKVYKLKGDINLLR
jgi:gliding motility-associated-like protein